MAEVKASSAKEPDDNSRAWAQIVVSQTQSSLGFMSGFFSPFLGKLKAVGLIGPVRSGLENGNLKYPVQLHLR